MSDGSIAAGGTGRRVLALVLVATFLVVATWATVVSLGRFCLTTEASALRGPVR